MQTLTWHTRASLAALCAMLTLPFLNPHHFHPIPTFYPEWTAAACALLAATLLLQSKVYAHLSLPRISLLPFGLAALTLLHLAFGRAPSTTQALLVLLYLLWGTLMLVLGRALTHHISLERLAVTGALALLVGSLLSALLLACQLMSPDLGLAWANYVFAHVKGGGNLAQANHLANYLWLGLVSALFLHARGTLGKVSFFVTGTTLLSAASLTGSRSVLLYAAAMTLLAFWAARRTPSPDLRRLACAAAGLATLCIVLQFLFSHLQLGSSLQTNLAGERIFREVEGASIRLQLWHTAWRMFTDHPWLGYGVGQFPFTAFLLAGEHPDTYVGGGEHAHNIVMHLLAEYGLGGALLLIGTTLAWWLHFARQDWTCARVWVAGILLVIGIHSQLEYPLWHTFFLGIAALLLGAGSRDGWPLQHTNLGRLVLSGMLLLGTVTLVNLGRDYRSLEHALNPKLRPQAERQDWNTTVSMLSRLHRNSLFAHYVELVYAFQMTVSREALADKIVVGEQALRLSPADAIAYKYAFLLGLTGRTEEAQQALHRAVASHPAYKATAAHQLTTLLREYPELMPLRGLLPETEQTSRADDAT